MPSPLSYELAPQFNDVAVLLGLVGEGVGVGLGLLLFVVLVVCTGFGTTIGVVGMRGSWHFPF
jgi:hypothetical protein